MGRKLYVGNLPYETNEQDLQDLFAQAGAVESVTVMRDRDTGRARGFAFVEMSSDDDASWLSGLRDPVVGRALAQLHGDPARAWTLPELAREVGASRTVLAERFAAFVGHSPMLYLTRWRMQLAATRLSAGAAPVTAVASEVGYESEAAFCRAFKRVTGVTPASWRGRRDAV